MKTTYDRLLEYFPVSMEPRPAQKEILETIAEGIDEGYHYFLLDAGTGIGKSAIAITLAKLEELSYKEIADIVGKSEASCKMAFFRAVSELRENEALALILFLPLITNFFERWAE